MHCPTDNVGANSAIHIPIGPADGPGHFSAGPNIAHQLAAEVGYRGEDATIDHIPLNLGKPDFHLLQLGRVSWGEAECHFRVPFQEVLDGQSFVSRKIVHNDVNLSCPARPANQTREEVNELGAGVASGGASLDLAGLDVQRRIERQRSMR